MHFKPAATSYEEVPYANDSYPASHPDRLAAVAKLRGLSPEPPDRCRVLELGCARGGNVIPMAARLPHSEFVAIDSSPRQIEHARGVMSALGLVNIAAYARDILEFDPALGSFHYIICHGTFSWVPTEVRDKILQIAARHLAPNGLAYISYNTYPGWHTRGLVRELMSYHARHYDSPADRAAAARGILQFVADSVPPHEPHYRGQLKEELEYVGQSPDSYLLHDHLEPDNHPVYFHEFVALARSTGLQFVSEVQTSLVAPEMFPPVVIKGLRSVCSDGVEFEQFVDFLINRKFRQSVLCRQESNVARTARPEYLDGLYVYSARTRSPAPAVYQNEPVLKAALGALEEIRPSALAVELLVEAARARLPAAAGADPSRQASDATDLRVDLLRAYSLKLIELAALPPSFVVKLSEQPVASPLARLQAEAGNMVTNLRHEAGQLSEFGRQVLRLLDGSRDRAALLQALAGSPEQSGAVPPREPHPSSDLLAARLDDNLRKFARFALLVA